MTYECNSYYAVACEWWADENETDETHCSSYADYSYDADTPWMDDCMSGAVSIASAAATLAAFSLMF